MEIRPARADDRGDIAGLMYSAGPELFDFLYKTDRVDAREFIAHEFRSGRGFCGWRNVTVAVVDGEVVATGCFYGGRDYGRLMRGSVVNALGFFRLAESLPMLLRSGQVDSIITRPAPDELYLASFAVAPAMRGRGVGEAVVRQQLATARARLSALFPGCGGHQPAGGGAVPPPRPACGARETLHRHAPRLHRARPAQDGAAARLRPASRMPASARGAGGKTAGVPRPAALTPPCGGSVPRAGAGGCCRPRCGGR